MVSLCSLRCFVFTVCVIYCGWVLVFVVWILFVLWALKRLFDLLWCVLLACGFIAIVLGFSVGCLVDCIWLDTFGQDLLSCALVGFGRVLLFGQGCCGFCCFVAVGCGLFWICGLLG